MHKPIIGLSPMDGITDSPFREIVDIYGHPDILFTEFIAADAIEKGAIKVLYGLFKHKTKTPVIAQIFGNNPKSLYKAAIVSLALGFNGIDINMGCPDRKVISRGGGAALIKTPKLAQDCIRFVKRAVKDWKEGISLEKADIHDDIVRQVRTHPESNDESILESSLKLLPGMTKNPLSVSVKTRIGYDSIITEEWISQLVETQPDLISVHGRTLRQMYHDQADWIEIGKAEKICHQAKIKIFGNGDIKNLNEATKKIKDYSLDGVLIGRVAMGNPWIFSDKTPTLKERVDVMKHHCQLFLKFRPDLQLMPMRKHLAWYCKGFPGSAEIRDKLTKITTMDDLKNILKLGIILR